MTLPTGLPATCYKGKPLLMPPGRARGMDRPEVTPGLRKKLSTTNWGLLNLKQDVPVPLLSNLHSTPSTTCWLSTGGLIFLRTYVRAIWLQLATPWGRLHDFSHYTVQQVAEDDSGFLC